MKHQAWIAPFPERRDQLSSTTAVFPLTTVLSMTKHSLPSPERDMSRQARMLPTHLELDPVIHDSGMLPQTQPMPTRTTATDL